MVDREERDMGHMQQQELKLSAMVVAVMIVVSRRNIAGMLGSRAVMAIKKTGDLWLIF